MIRMLSVIVMLMLVSACSSLPQSLHTTNEKVITDYQQWLNLPQEQVKEIRLGGIIAKVTNLSDKTRIEVVNIPISSNGKPSLDFEPSGRFVAYVDGYVEPMAYTEGRLVTLLGISQGEELGKVDEFELAFPVMRVTGSHLWRIEETVVVRDVDSHFSPCYGLYCRSYKGLPSKGKVVQEVK
ncbi:Slp family lipoprotein [Vibrio sp. TH_r3]|uniref:Slp family lipoprotein n=1 Tax=Vibrio sp. TH_r3 TaxID=3082084 RepID=UPI0029533C13|nr:Slp family lipoprotein [Vibrio sp. TH_r3]MDV7104030.1 Slp family lipoprotein [Vibrio sp. TH_r3]